MISQFHGLVCIFYLQFFQIQSVAQVDCFNLLPLLTYFYSEKEPCSPLPHDCKVRVQQV